MDKAKLATAAITLCIAILIVGIIVVLSNNASHIKTNTPTNTPTPTPTPTESPPTPTALPIIDITYHTTSVGTIDNDTPMSGYEFILVNITIVNKGYPSFEARPYYFYFTGSDAYSYDAVYTKYNHDNYFDVEIPSGGNFSGSFVISTPIDVSIIGLTYMFKGYNIETTRT